MSRKGLERSNAAQMSAAGDGSTEPNLYPLPIGADVNESLSAYQKSRYPFWDICSSLFDEKGTRKGGTSAHTGAKIESW